MESWSPMRLYAPITSLYLYIRVFNPREQPVILKKGELIARMEPVGQKPILVNSVGITLVQCYPRKTKKPYGKWYQRLATIFRPRRKSNFFSVLSAYGDAFSLHDNDVGHTLATKHRIDTGNAPLVHCSPRRDAPCSEGGSQKTTSRHAGKKSNPAI